MRHSGTRGCFRAPRSFSPPQPPSSPSRGMESWLPAGPPPPPSSPRDPARPSPQCLPQAVPPLSHTRSPCAPPAAWFAPAYLQAPSLHPPGGTAVPAPAESGWGGSHSLRFVFPLRLPSPAPPPPRSGRSWFVPKSRPVFYPKPLDLSRLRPFPTELAEVAEVAAELNGPFRRVSGESRTTDGDSRRAKGAGARTAKEETSLRKLPRRAEVPQEAEHRRPPVQRGSLATTHAHCGEALFPPKGGHVLPCLLSSARSCYDGSASAQCPT